MNIIFMGTPDLAAGVLQALLDAGYPITAVVTQPDKPKGRKKTPAPSPVKELAIKSQLPLLQPEKVRDPEFIRTLTDLSPDMIVVAAFGQIIPEAILQLPRCGCVNVHASLLPKYRGAAPIQWSILDGEAETGVTLMRMDAGLDTGDMIASVTVPVAADDTGETLYDKLCSAGGRLLVDTIPAIESGSVVYTPQPAESPTHYASMITKQMGKIDWNESASAIDRRIRALSPWPSAYTALDGKTLKIWKADVLPGDPSTAADVGKVIQTSDNAIAIQTGSGVLCVRELQLEGKKRMITEDFLRGHTIPAGTFVR